MAARDDSSPQPVAVVDVGGPRYSPDIPAGQQGSQVALVDPRADRPEVTPTPTLTDPRLQRQDAGPVVNPDDILSNTPRTWGEFGKGLGWAGLSGGLYGVSTPGDLVTGAYDLAAKVANERFGQSWDYLSTPGQQLQSYLGIPQATTFPEHLVSGAVQAPVSMLYGSVFPGARIASVVRGAPTQAAIGGGLGGMDYLGAGPEAQLGTAFAAALLAHRMPGLVTKASPTDLDLAEGLRNEKVPVNPVDLGPEGAKTTYGFLGQVPGMAKSAINFAKNQYKAWTDAAARRMGGADAATDEDGLFTPKVLEDATNRINGLYTTARAAPPMPFNPTTSLYGDLTTIANDAAAHGTPTASANNVVDFVNRLKTFAYNQGGRLNAADMADMLRTDSHLANLTSGDPAMAGYYRRIRAAVDTAFGDHLVRTAPDSYVAYQEANNSYRSMQTISAALKAGNGQLTPANLAEAVKASPFEQAAGDAGLRPLAQGGVRFVAVPDTPEPVAASFMNKKQGTMASLRQLGFAGIGLHELTDIAEALPGGRFATGTVGAASYPLGWAQSRAARAMPLSGPSPTARQYYVNQLLRVPQIARSAQPDPNQPLVPPLIMQQF